MVSILKPFPSFQHSVTRPRKRWEKIREKDDIKGLRHVFYRQFYRPPIGPVSAVSPAASEGVWLVGAEIGLHYDRDGNLVFGFGTQFDDVVATSVPHIGDRTGAAAATDKAVVDWPDHLAIETGRLSPQMMETRLFETTLLLYSEDDGRSFDYVWEVPSWDTSGSMHTATLNAESGELIALEEAAVWSECSPNSDDQDYARGVPQNSGVTPWRYIWATETDDRGVSYTHEAHKISSGSNPDIQIFMGMDGDGCNNNDYALMPIKTISSVVRYDDYTTPEFVPGRSGTDAMYFTYQTMVTFDDLGRDGWDDSGSDAVVVVDSDCGGVTDNATMVYSGTRAWAPTPSVAVCSNVNQSYESSAAIDVIAHEWGHGVVFTSANWSRSTFLGKVYHEGWADVIGHLVEWDNQTSGSGTERAEWKLGEDRGAATELRRVDYDDGVGGYSLHADDPPGDPTSEHDTGNRLGTAFYLMAEGGENPACDRDPDPGWDGCDEDVDGIGVSKAGQILFYALTDFATSSSDWDDFGDLAKTAAFFFYANCPTSNARSEQRAAIDAFQAIGYFPSNLQIQCGP